MPDQHSDQELQTLLRQMNLVPPQALQECLDIQKKFAQFGKPMTLASLLVKKKCLTQQQLDNLWATAPSDGVVARPRDNALRRFSRYHIIRELGRGGMGVVYEAFDPNLSRNVALKVIGELQSGDREQQRFVREAHLMARLEHPNIIKVFDVGQENGKHFFTMELVQGQNLDKLLADKVPQPQLLRLLAKVAEAVHYAHQQGVIHRDLKPSNIMVTTQFEPKVMDFGLAKEVEKAAQQLSQSTDIIGTPKYMSPEQAGGRTKEVDARSDVYALGVILYEMLTSRTPFSADNTVNLFYQIMFAEPLPPSRYDRGISRDLEAICLKALEKDRDRRYHSAHEMATDIGNYLDGHSVIAKPATPTRKLGKWMRRHRLVTAASTVFAILLVSVVSYFIYQLQRRAVEESRLRKLAEQKTLLATKKEREARQHAIGTKLSQAEAELLLARTFIDNQDFLHAQQRHATAEKLLQNAGGLLRQSAGEQDASGDTGWLAERHRALAIAADGMLRYCLSGNITQTREISLTDVRLSAEAPQHIVARVPASYLQMPSTQPSWRFVGLCQQETANTSLWDMQERKMAISLPFGITWTSCAIAFSMDDTAVALGNLDGDIALWQTTGEKIAGANASSGKNKVEIWGLRWSPDRKWIFVSTNTEEMSVWQATPLKPLYTMNYGHKYALAAFSANSKWLALRGSNEIYILLFDTEEFAKKAARPDYQVMASRTIPGRASAVCFGPQDRTLITADANDIRIFPLLPGEEGVITLLAAHRGKILDLAVSDDGNYFASIGQDGRLVVWSTYNYRKLWEAPFVGRTGLFCSVRFHPQRPLIGAWNYTCLNLYTWQTSFDKRVNLLKSGDQTKAYENVLTTMRHTSLMRNQGNSMVAVTFCPDGRHVACYQFPHLYLWDLHNDSVSKLKSHFVQDRLRNTGFSSDGTLLMSRGQDQIYLWRVADQKLLTVTSAKNKDDFCWQPVTNLVVNRTGKGNRIQFSKIDGDKLLLDKEIVLTSLAGKHAFSSDGQQLAIETTGEVIEIWDVNSTPPQLLSRKQLNEESEIATMCFGEPDFLAMGEAGGDFLLYDWRRQEVRHRLQLYNPVRQLWYDASESNYWIHTQDSLFVYRYAGNDSQSGKLDLIYPLPLLAGYPIMDMDIAGDFRRIAILSQSGEAMLFNIHKGK